MFLAEQTVDGFGFVVPFCIIPLLALITAFIAKRFNTPKPPAKRPAVVIYIPAVKTNRLSMLRRRMDFPQPADNLHPDGNEQQLLWLNNRACANSAQEGIWLGLAAR
ncbi:MAG: hypothetical protein R2911_36785 [Caldilineaceae bacterium]